MTDRSLSFFGGLLLVSIGAAFLLSMYFSWAWAAFLMVGGAAILATAVTRHKRSLLSTGILTTMLGGILLYQSATGDWKSWYYLWALLFAAVGGGILLESRVEPQADWAHGRYRRAGWSFLLLGLIVTTGLWFVRASLAWPVIIWGMGALFLAAALASRVSPLAIPGAILYGIGVLFAWQNITGDFTSWRYVWTLIPAFVGSGLLLSFLHSRVMRVVSILMVLGSLLAFTVFALLLGSDGTISRIIPFVLIAIGIAVLMLPPHARQTRKLPSEQAQNQ